MSRDRENSGEESRMREGGTANSDLSIDDIRGAAGELRRKVAALKQAKAEDIERKVAEHDQLGPEILSLRELLATAQETRDYFVAVKQARELPAGGEDQMPPRT